MPAARVIEAINVSKYASFGLAMGCPFPTPDQLGLDSLEERLDSGVVMAIALAALRRLQAVFAQGLLVAVRTVLAATVAMENAAPWREPADTSTTSVTPDGSIRALTGRRRTRPILPQRHQSRWRPNRGRNSLRKGPGVLQINQDCSSGTDLKNSMALLKVRNCSQEGGRILSLWLAE